MARPIPLPAPVTSAVCKVAANPVSFHRVVQGNGPGRQIPRVSRKSQRRHLDCTATAWPPRYTARPLAATKVEISIRTKTAAAIVRPPRLIFSLTGRIKHEALPEAGMIDHAFQICTWVPPKIDSFDVSAGQALIALRS